MAEKNMARKPAFIDRAIAKVSPKWALEREVARRRLEFVNSGYGAGAANTDKKSMIGFPAPGGSANEDIHEHLDMMRRRSRELYMAVPLATGAVNTVRTNVIGPGLRLKSTPDAAVLGITDEEAEELGRKIEREFAIWAESTMCDAGRMDNFYSIQQLAFMNWLLSGDVLVLLPVTPRPGLLYDLRLQLVEADRIGTPIKSTNKDIQDGVEVDRYGGVTAYWICRGHPYAADALSLEYDRVEAYGKNTGRQNVLHLMNRERIGQRRGIPFLACVTEAIKQIGRYTDAELMAAVVNGLFTVFIEHEDVTSGFPPGAGIPEEQLIDRQDENSVEMGNGSVVDLNPGEKAVSVTPGRPNENFEGFVDSICKQIGAALEIPKELLIKQFNSNYSASRAALLEAWKMFRMRRGWMVDKFCTPVYAEWFTEAVAKGRISAPGFFTDPVIRNAYLACEWNGPTQGQLDPVKEANAAAIRVENGFSTRQREAQEMNGSDYDMNVAQLAGEEQRMKKIWELRGKYPDGTASADPAKEDDDAE